MALIAGFNVFRRGQPKSGTEYAYPVAPGEKVFRGGLGLVNASGYVVRLQTAGGVGGVGVIDRDIDNSTYAVPSTFPATLQKGTFRLPVPGATFSNIGQAVYATDDATLGLGGLVAAAATTGTGNGQMPLTGAGQLVIGAAAKAGAYVLTLGAGGTTFTIVDPNGDALPAGTVGVAYADPAISFTLSQGGVAFAAGDKVTVTLSADAAGATLVGTLTGVDGGFTYVTIIGS